MSEPHQNLKDNISRAIDRHGEACSFMYAKDCLGIHYDEAKSKKRVEDAKKKILEAIDELICEREWDEH